MATILETTIRPYGPADAGIPLTPDEFEAAEYEEGYRYELIHGVLVVTPPPAEGERDGNEDLGRWLRNYQDDHEQGGCLDLTLPEHNIRTGDHNRRADRVIWTGLGRTPRTRGRIDRFRRTMIVYHWRGKRWVKKTVREGDVYTTSLLPGFELSLAKFLAVSDKYQE